MITNLSWISFKILLSSSEVTNEIAKPLVPNLPARPTLKVSEVSYSVHISISTVWHVVVDNNVDPDDVDSSSEKVSRDHDPLFEFFELFVLVNSLNKIFPTLYLSS